MLKLKLFFISFFFTLIHVSANDSIVKFKSTEQLLNISPYLYIYEDVSGTLAFNEVIKKEFKITKNTVPNLGISESVFWIKIQISNSSKEEHLLLSVTLPTLDKIEFYAQDNKAIYTSVIAGEQFRFFQRKYIDPDYLFDIYIPEDSIKTFYFKISSKEGIQLPMALGTEIKMFNQIKNRDIISGIYFGIMIAMILYNLFLFFSIKDISYIYYVVYIVLILITQTALQGYPFQYLWPNHPQLAQKSLFIFPSLVSIAGLEFIRLFLQLKTRSKLLYTISYVFYLPYLTSIALAFAGYYKISFHTMEFSSMSVSIYMLITPIVILRQGFQPAKYFLAAWSVFLVGICIYVLKDIEILPFNNFTRYTMQIGSAIETVLLSFALADRINALKKEKEVLIVGQNIVLEQKVTERTQELKETNNNLSATLINLKDTQAQLLNIEKMASLGQLTAGIAHEINNPINFVSANLKPLKMDISEILEIVKKYESIKSEDILEDKLKEIEIYKKEIDIEYLKKEIETLLSGIEDGAKRTTEIVSGLKTFSRLDESEVKECNINEGIQSTLTLLKHSIPQNVDVIVNLGTIPNIECLPGKLNQVFMNILTNALYAINQKKSEEKNTLIVTTYTKGENVYASFEDTGIGMTQEIKNKIFEPFFTTKDVGEGTGLGMSIVFKIIETHQAKIEIETTYGEGTKVILILNKKNEIIKMTNKIRVLYLDDEENNLSSFRAYFRKEYEVFTANNAKEAFQILENNIIPIIISDQRMPSITGIEFLEQTIEKYPDSLRMLITAYADMGLVIEAVNRGQINKFIQKPWNWDELTLCIKDCWVIYKLREDLKEKNEQLQKANDELNKFVYSISHDLRAPLMSILGLVQLSKNEQQSNVIESYFDNIKTCVVKLDTFIINMIDYYKNIHAQEIKHVINLEELVSNVYDSLRNLDSNVIFESEINQVENFTSDLFRLEVIFKNLISNAIKYQNPKNENPKVNVKITSTKKETNIVILDNGIGIANDHIQNIFNLFFRIGSSSKKEGSGIGLYIVKEAIEKIGGTITVESTPLVGTSFTIIIPNN